MMEILNNEDNAGSAVSGTGRKRERKRQGKNAAVGQSTRNSSFTAGGTGNKR